MVLSSLDVSARLRTPSGTKLLKYSAASVISIFVSVVCLVIFDGLFRWDAVVSSTLATAIATVPSYELNRKWAWGKRGRGHLWREVVPFWALAFAGWAFSTYSVKVVESALKSSALPHLEKTGIIVVVYIGAFGVLWVVKFILFNKLLFAPRASEPAGEPRGAVDAVTG